MNLLKVLLGLLAEAPVRPRWAFHRAQGYASHYIFDRGHQRRKLDYEHRTRPLDDAVADVLGRSKSEILAVDDSDLVRNLIVEGKYVTGFKGRLGVAAAQDGPIELRYGPSPELVRLVNLVVRLAEPEFVVETGVAKGFTSASILEALAINRKGSLTSIELPSLYAGYTRQVGERIPAELRSRWSLELGPSAVRLPKVIERLGRIDVLVHDSAANYRNQQREFSTALENMPSGGVIVCNQVNNDAFLEVAEHWKCHWAVIKHTKVVPLGIMSKPWSNTGSER